MKQSLTKEGMDNRDITGFLGFRAKAICVLYTTETHREKIHFTKRHYNDRVLLIFEMSTF